MNTDRSESAPRNRPPPARPPGRESDWGASLILRGPTLDPDEVTNRLGMRPSRARAPGILSPVTGRPYPDGAWIVESDQPPWAPLDAHVAAVLSRVAGLWHELKGLAAEHSAGLSCVVHSFGGDTPTIGFDPVDVRRLAELGAWIDVDLYVEPRRTKPQREAA